MFSTGTRILAGLIGLACTGAEPLLAKQPSAGLPYPADKLSAGRERIRALLANGEPGSCHRESPMYLWRKFGFGSNLNQLLILWVESIHAGYQDCIMDVAQDFLHQVQCSSGEAGKTKDIVGWRCMFKPMPRLCTLETSSVEDQRMARRNYASNVTGKHPLQELPGKATIASAIVGFMYSHTQPWFEEDISAILREWAISSLREEKFVAIHVRRGDKLRREASRVEVWVYLQAAALHLWESSGDRSGIESISGIWVSSDDSTVFPEVQELASRYFPNVQADKIITISFRDDGADDRPEHRGDELATKSSQMTYELYVGLNAELRMMSEADIFVGTFSSNIARFVYLMRDSNGLPRNSTLSVDEPAWSLK